MWFQEYERYEIFQVLADIIGLILNFFKPIVTPIGEWMVVWVNFLLGYFPSDSLLVYIVIFVVFIVAGVIINTKWPGEKYVAVYTKDEPSENTSEGNQGIEFLEKK